MTFEHGGRAGGAPRATARGVGLAIVTSLATLALLELGARALVPPALPRTTMYRAAPEVAYELVPGFEGRGPLGERIRIDRDGMRGTAAPAGDSDAGGVLVVGDSFTFGLGVDERDTFPAALARALPATTRGRPVDVRNAGVPGYNLFQERRALETRTTARRPDVIVVGFVENDLYNVDGSDFVVVADGGLVPRPGAFQAAVTLNPFAALSGPWLWLQLHSAAFRAATMPALRGRLAIHGDAELATIAAGAATDADLPAMLLRGDDVAATASRFDAAARELRAMAAFAAQHGARIALVLLPRPEQLYDERLRGGFARIARAAASTGFVVVDPSSALATEPDRVGLFLFPADHHPNARYHARVAELVAEALGDAVARLP